MIIILIHFNHILSAYNNHENLTFSQMHNAIIITNNIINKWFAFDLYYIVTVVILTVVVGGGSDKRSSY